MKPLLLLLLLFCSVTSHSRANCFPKDPLTSFDVPERYSRLSPELINVLRKSYLRHTKKNHYLDNAFWGTNPEDPCTWPESLWEALDRVGPNQIYTLANIFQKTNRAFVTSTISAIRNIWYGTSFGFTFEGTDANLSDMVAYIKEKGTFCKDSETISKREHNGQICWRQIPKDRAGMGLHFCYGAGRPTEVHIDFNQVAIGHLPFSDTCLYDPIAVYKHYKDLKGKPPKTIFDSLEEERKDLERTLESAKLNCQGFEKYLVETNLERMIERLSPGKIMAVASLGEGALKAGMGLISKNLADKEKLFRFASCICP